MDKFAQIDCDGTGVSTTITRWLVATPETVVARHYGALDKPLGSSPYGRCACSSLIE